MVESKKATKKNDKGSKTSLEMDENTEGMLCYVGIWVTGLIFMLLEKKSEFVKFHAMQSFVVFMILTVAYILVRWIPDVGQPLSTIVFLVGVVLWIVLILKAYQGEKYKIPKVTEYIEKK